MSDALQIVSIPVRGWSPLRRSACFADVLMAAGRVDYIILVIEAFVNAGEIGAAGCGSVWMGQGFQREGMRGVWGGGDLRYGWGTPGESCRV